MNKKYSIACKHLLLALKTLIDSEFQGNQSKFALESKVERATCANDLSGIRKIPDERFGRYLGAVSKTGRSILIRARMLDLIPEEFHGELVGDDKLSESWIPVFPRELLPEIREAITWLANEIVADPGLEELITLFCKQLGWSPQPKNKVKY